MYWYIVLYLIGMITGWAICAVMANSRIQESLLEQLVIKEDIVELLHILKTYIMIENNSKIIDEIEKKLSEM